MTPPMPPDRHTDVGAYALGVLDAADADRFEAHLVGCDRCAAELEQLMRLTPVMAEFKQSAPTPQTITAVPGPAMLDGLLDVVTTTRRGRARRRLFLVAAAVVLIVGGPVATFALKGAEEAPQSPPSPPLANAVRAQYAAGEKVSSVDPDTKVSAGVSMAARPWGTQVVLELANVKGPLACDLVAVGKDGKRQTVTTWAVPKGGYGIPGSTAKWNREPLYAAGGAALNRGDIDHFEINTLDGKRLAKVNV
ncbi:putative zinc finger protein [Streptomyces sp. 2333.5]|uniref:anti-sigma factor family protein n=1 Tax=unclassified Streptomyces TaxID=2593676 RepID=UPI00089B5CA2|nr:MULTISPECIES: zf-HC2 domain-containing protein [unclassified Streptomyces]PJJ02262.1 putative zinc finger protein [Streptomyces sp. 2333.5]SED02466.1 Putative zinc-finger [Streptomyces sp. 2314.4]SED88764.1 Putative zinc-finger [Streptomyces sp. 2112.2]